MADEPFDIRSLDVDSDVHVRDLAKREIDVRIVPYGVAISTIQGPEVFARGALADTDPTRVRLMGMEHEASIGLGQDGRPKLTRHPIGKALSIWEDDTAGYGTFRVAQTPRGDEALALAADGIVSGVSIEFSEVPGGSVTEMVNGRRTKVHKRVRMTGLSPTYQPAYETAQVLAVRTEEETATVSDTPVIEAIPPEPVDFGAIKNELLTAVRGQGDTFTRSFDAFAERLLRLEDGQRKDIDIPANQSPAEVPHAGHWMSAVVRMFSGDHLSDSEMRTVADLITSDNIGVVPPAYSTEIVGIIDPRRPFLASTRRIPTPDSGMSIYLPKITTRPTVATQAEEKDELSSTATAITTVHFDAVTKGGVGDLSLQLIKRSSPSFLSLYLELLAEAYAINTEDAAVDVAIAASGVNSGGALDPEALTLGAAWSNATAAMRRGPDTIWLSSSAVAAFLDAKATASNQPLYGNLQADFSVPGGVGGNIQGLRPVWVPALDDEAVDILVGPSTGFLWAEDGAYQLQVDVPSKAGRDVALVGMIWLMPVYPAAFTKYTLAS